MSKRWFAVVLAGLMLLCAACGSSENSSHEESSQEVSKEESSKAESSAEESSAQESSRAVMVMPAGNLNPLTGLYDISDEAVGKRPVAIMINNIKDSLPQYGIAGADIMFEMVAEEGISRMMAIWADYTAIPDACSVRSARPYYVDFAAGFDALYLHVGGSQAGLDRIKELGVSDLDAIYGDYGLYERDPERLKTYALEHTMYVKGQNIPQAMEEYGIRTELDETHQGPAFSFQMPGNAQPVGEKKCEELTIWYSDEYYSTFTYNDQDGLYYKQHSGQPHMVQDTGTQLVFTNVLVLETNVSSVDGYRMAIESDGGTGYFFSNGTMLEIEWSKRTPYDQIQVKDKDGKEVVFNAGKTYIGVTEYGMTEVK